MLTSGRYAAFAEALAGRCGPPAMTGTASPGPFRSLREDDFTGGFVLRRFEEFATAEARTWWVDGVCRLIGPHPDTPHDDPPPNLDLSTLTPLVAALRLPFVSVSNRARTTRAVRRVSCTCR
jgi:hypothetical protein